MLLTQIERDVLFAAQFNPLASMTEISRVAGVKPHTARYHLSRIQQKRYVQLTPFVNFYALGLRLYQVYFSHMPEKHHISKKALLTKLSTFPSLLWIGELVGEYEYGMTIIAKNTAAISDVLDELSENCGIIFSKKVINPMISYSYCRRRYLHSTPERVAARVLSIHPVETTYDLDETDSGILSCLFENSGISNTQISDRIGVPRSTVDFRLSRLQERGILLGFVYQVHPLQMGLLSYKLFVSTRGAKKRVKDRFLSFALKHRAVAAISHCVGDWDFELVVEVNRAEDVLEIREEIFSEFQDLLQEIKIFPLFRQTHSNQLWKSLAASGSKCGVYHYC